MSADQKALRGTAPKRSRGLKRRRIKVVPEAVLEDPAARWLWHFARGEAMTFTVATVAFYANLPVEQFEPTVTWFKEESWIHEVQPGVYTGLV